MSESFDAKSGREAEIMKEAVIRDNVQLMDTKMIQLLMTESFGGNAGEVVVDGKKYPAAGANAVVDRLSGKIVAFGNMVMVSHRKMETPVCFQVAVDIMGRRGFFRIVRVFPGSHRDMTSPGTHPEDVLDTHAVDVLQRSIDRWNAGHEDEPTQPK